MLFRLRLSLEILITHMSKIFGSSITLNSCFCRIISEKLVEGASTSAGLLVTLTRDAVSLGIDFTCYRSEG